eukprot:233831_1
MDKVSNSYRDTRLTSIHMSDESHNELLLDEKYHIENEIKGLREIAQNIDNNTYGIVCGYIIIADVQMPLEIVDLIYGYVGNHFTNQKGTESTQRIMAFIANTREPLCELYGHTSTPCCTYCIGAVLTCFYCCTCCACFNCCQCFR